MKYLLGPFLFLGILEAAEVSDAFIVRIFENSVKVIAPAKYTKKVNVIFENQTLSEIRGKLVSEDFRFRRFVTIYPYKPVTAEIPVSRKKRNLFIPLAPSSQSVILKIGAKSYEVPPRELLKKAIEATNIHAISQKK